MTTITINKKEMSAEIWVQSLTVGGIVKDKDGNKTFISVQNKGIEPVKAFFNRVKEKTGLEFFRTPAQNVA